MPMFIRRLVVQLAILSGAILSSAHAATLPGVKATWHRYASPNFELYSCVAESPSRELLERLETLHAVVLENSELTVRRAMPVTVFYFNRPADYRSYLPASFANPERVAGLYLSQPDRATIILPFGTEESATGNVIFHEYVHHLMRITEQNPPLWYNEGMAELFSTFRVRAKDVTLGLAAEDRVLDLRTGGLMPITDLLGATEGSLLYRGGTAHTGIFYAQSWALVHYCYLGASDLPRDSLRRFLAKARVLPPGTPAARFATLAESELGIGLDELNRRLRNYIQNGRYQALRIRLPSLPPSSGYPREPVSATDVSFRLAELQLRMRADPWAKIYLEQGLRDGREDARVHEVLGSLALAQDDLHTTRQHWNRAIELGSTNVSVYHELALIESRSLFGQYDPYYRLPEAAGQRLRFLLTQSIGRAPGQSAAYERLAWVEAFSGSPNIANINLVQEKFLRLTDRQRTLLALATARWRLGDYSGADSLLTPLLEVATDEWARKGAERLKALVVARTPPPRRS